VAYNSWRYAIFCLVQLAWIPRLLSAASCTSSEFRMSSVVRLNRAASAASGSDAALMAPVRHDSTVKAGRAEILIAQME